MRSDRQRNGSSDVTAQGHECGFRVYLFLALAQKIARAIVALDRAEGMFTGLHAFLLSFFVVPDKEHHPGRRVLDMSVGVIMTRLGDIGDLLHIVRQEREKSFWFSWLL